MASIYDYLMKYSPDHREKLIKIAHVILSYDRAKEKGLGKEVANILSEVITKFWIDRLKLNIREAWFRDVVKKFRNDLHMDEPEAIAIASIVGYVYSRSYTKEAYEYEVKSVGKGEGKIIWRGVCDVALMYGLLRDLGLVKCTELNEICEIYNEAAREVAREALKLSGLNYDANVVKEVINRDHKGCGTCIEKVIVRRIE